MLLSAGSQSHASFIERIPSGYAVAWFSGDGEGGSGVGIYTSVKGPGLSDNWSTPELVAREVGFSMQNPVLLYDPDTKKLHLLHTCQEARIAKQQIGYALHQQQTARIWHHISGVQDGILEFHKIQEFPHGPGIFDRNRILRDPNGDGWLFPVYYTLSDYKTDDYSAILRLRQGSLSFDEELRPEGWLAGLVQPTIVALSTGKDLIAFFRDRKKANIFWSNSTDGGRAWSRAEATQLENNNAGIHATAVANGSVIILVFNPIHRRRYRLSVAVSFDKGRSWPIFRDLECHLCHGSNGDVQRKTSARSGNNHGPEYSYPSILEGGDGNLHITYTWSLPSADMGSNTSIGLRETIKYVVLTKEYLGI